MLVISWSLLVKPIRIKISWNWLKSPIMLSEKIMFLRGWTTFRNLTTLKIRLIQVNSIVLSFYRGFEKEVTNFWVKFLQNLKIYILLGYEAEIIRNKLIYFYIHFSKCVCLDVPVSNLDFCYIQIFHLVSVDSQTGNDITFLFLNYVRCMYVISSAVPEHITIWLQFS